MECVADLFRQMDMRDAAVSQWQELFDQNTFLRRDHRRMQDELTRVRAGGNTNIVHSAPGPSMSNDSVRMSMDLRKAQDDFNQYKTEQQSRVHRLKAELQKKQTEITEQYNRTVKIFLENEKQKSEIERLEKLSAETQEKLDTATFQLSDLRQCTAEQKRTIDTLTMQLNSHLKARQELEHRCVELEGEYNTLIQRWKEKAEEDANRLNADNDAAMRALQAQNLKALSDQVMSEFTGTLPPRRASDSQGPVSFCRPPTKVGRTIAAHDDEVNCLAFNFTGTLLASGSSDFCVKVWDSLTGAARWRWRDASQMVMSVAFSPSGDLLLSTGNDRNVRIYDVNRGRLIHTMSGHSDKVFSGKFTLDNHVITGGHDRVIKIWDLNRVVCVRNIGCLSSCNAISLGMGGGMLASAHVDHSVRIWDPRTGGSIHTLEDLHAEQVTSVTFSNDSRLMLTSGKDDRLVLIEPRTWRQLHVLGHQWYRCGFNWTKAAFSPDARYALIGGALGRLYVWDTNTGRHEAVISRRAELNERDFSMSISEVGWNPNGSQVASAHKDGKVLTWVP